VTVAGSAPYTPLQNGKSSPDTGGVRSPPDDEQQPTLEVLLPEEDSSGRCIDPVAANSSDLVLNSSELGTS
jgi:hypothetical protein